VTLSVVQHASATKNQASGTAGTAAPAFASNTAAGNCLVAVISVAVFTGTPSIASVTTNGTAENWTLAKSETRSSGSTLITAIYVDPNTGGGQKIIDVNCSFTSSLASNDAEILVDIYEVAGVAASSMLDQVAGATNTGSPTTFSSGATPTTTAASEIEFGGVGAFGNVGAVAITGPSSPWTNETTLTGTFFTADFNISQKSGFNIVSSTGTATYSGTQTNDNEGYAAVIVTLRGGGVTGTGSARIPKMRLAASVTESIPSTGSVRVTKPGPHGTAVNALQARASVRIPKMGLHVAAGVMYNASGGVKVPKMGLHASGMAFNDAAFITLPKMGVAATGAVEATGTGSAAMPKPAPHIDALERIPSAGSVRLPKMGVAARASEGDNLTGSVRVPKMGLHAAGVNALQAIAVVAIPKPHPHATGAESFALHGGVAMRKMTLSGTAGQQPAGLGGVVIPKMAVAAGNGRVIRRFLQAAPDKLSRSGGTMGGVA